MNRLDLSGPWRLADTGGQYAVAMRLPGDAISALSEAGVLPDPYWGRNEFDCRWVAERDWVISREFDLDRIDVTLVVDQVDTVAKVKINGVSVLDANNAFRAYRCDVSHAVRPGTNVIEIEFPSSVRVAAERQCEQPFFVPFQSDNCPIPNPNMLRKPQCDFGWDWNIALAPFGVYGEVGLEPTPAARIERLEISQDHSGSGVLVSVAAHVSGGGSVAFTLDGQVHTAPVGSDGSAEAEIRIEDPQLWWPAGQGEQPLYELTATLGDQVERRRLGLRRLELVNIADDIGASFAIQANDRPVFCKGANWIPADALPGRIKKEKTRDLLQSAVDANMNMIRVWGGGRYEPDWFYDFCDELGLMIWQDFMFACALYPSDEAFLSEVDGEVRETVARLHHHASIALWCGDNENVGALGWFEESRKNRDRYLVAYDRLNYAIERALKTTDPGANWWPSSPSRGRLDFGDGWHDDTSGDMHFWSVWHEGRDFDHYRDVAPRFCSEFGFQSYPSMDQIRTFTDPSDLNISSPVFESHQKNAGGNARIAETMFRYFRFPSGFENFVYLSQVQQAMAIKTAVTHWRAQKPRCQGTLIWQLNDTWPVCSWSSLDYGGGWKLLHHAAESFFAPVLCTIVPEAEGFDLVGVVDGGEDQEIAFELSAINMDGAMRPLASGASVVRNDGAEKLAQVLKAEVKDTEILVYRWRSGASDWTVDHHAPHPYKAYELPESQLRFEADGNEITLYADRPSFFAALEADVPGRFTRNAILVLPGAPETLQFLPRDPAAAGNFTLRDLYSATVAHQTT